MCMAEMRWGGHQDRCQRGAQIPRPTNTGVGGLVCARDLSLQRAYPGMGQGGKGWVEWMVCSGQESWGGVGAGLVDPPSGMTGLGEGQPRPKVIVSLLPWQRTPLNREPEKGWRGELPGPWIWGQREEQRPGRRSSEKE